MALLERYMRVIIAGGRDFSDYQLLKDRVNYYMSNASDVVVICGEAKGADLLGKNLAKENGWLVKSFPAKWELHGKSAGYIRNKEMADTADVLVAFWDGKSRGTANMIEIAKKKGLPVRIVRY